MNDILSITLDNLPNSAIREICGHHQSHLKIIEEELSVNLTLIGSKIAIQGGQEASEKAKNVLKELARISSRQPSKRTDEFEPIDKKTI